MTTVIYEADDIRGADFAFDAIGNLIDWSPVVRAAKTSKSVRLTLRVEMLFTVSGEAEHPGRGTVVVPMRATADKVKARCYEVIRTYIARIARLLKLPKGETPSDTVALLTSITMTVN